MHEYKTPKFTIKKGITFINGTKVPLWLLRMYRADGYADEIIKSNLGLMKFDLANVWDYILKNEEQIKREPYDKSAKKAAG